MYKFSIVMIVVAAIASILNFVLLFRGSTDINDYIRTFFMLLYLGFFIYLAKYNKNKNKQK